jgi:hypothetical protein
MALQHCRRSTCAPAAAPAPSSHTAPLRGVPPWGKGGAPVGIAPTCPCIATRIFGSGGI